MKPKIIIIGAGGHGKVVCDAIEAQNKYEILGFVDTTIPVGQLVTGKYTVIASQNNSSSLKEQAEYFIVAIGSNSIRSDIFNSLKQILKPAIVIHPSSVIGSNTSIGDGCVVLPNSVINSFTSIGENTIVGTGVLIDHECKIGSNIHLSLGTIVGSNSEVTDNYTTSIGAIIESFSKIR